MATKTKGTNAKIKELKGIKPETISKEHLDKMQELINSLNRSQLEIGSMELRKHEVMHNMESLRDDLTTLQKEFEKDYGTFDVNIQTGKINHPENVETDS